MTPTDDLTAKAHALILRARAALSRGDDRTYRHTREDLAAIVQQAFRKATARTASRYAVDVDDVDGGRDCARYVDDLIAGVAELPRCLEAFVGKIAGNRTIDEVQRRAKRTQNEAARFTESGRCTPVGSAGEEISAGAISAATVSPSHEDQVMMRLAYRDAVAGMTYDERVATVGFDAVGLPTEECCDLIGCSAGSFYVRRHRFDGPAGAWEEVA